MNDVNQALAKEGDLNYSIRQGAQSKIHSLIWTIPFFVNYLDKKTTQEIRTKPETALENRFQLKMHFLGHNNELIELYYLYPTPVFLKAIVTICMKRFEERSIVMNDYHTCYPKKWQYITTLFKRDIVGKEGVDYFLSDGSLRLKYSFYITKDVKVEYTSNVPASELCHDLESLLNNGLFSDVTMESCDGTSFNVHKAVLASRSAVLKAHFQHNTTESQTNIIHSSVDAEVLREILTFVYSDKAPKIYEFPEKLLAAADFYQLNRLKSLCEEALHQKLTVENAIETLTLADLHSATHLKKLTLEFIKDGQAKLITKTSGWKDLKSVELIKNIYEYIIEDAVLDVDIK
ncbi:speckle-type POZ protein-like [Aricia agestis]|uniref:speckle-type POZ protein-like n=1 Tax=Aricia agestis TaxID=91739 RepID=UPI001C206EC3|nr:speckle-type POZ protein-like [Aricia agestis]